MWEAGDHGADATRLPITAELLCDRAELAAGARVLDVVTGTGDAALAAARRSRRVVGVDVAGRLLAHARRRAHSEGLEVDFVEGDAERLPFDSDSFDAVISVFGVMFVPSQQQAADELVRVCRRGGTIALASWTPGSVAAETFRLVAGYMPSPPGVETPPSLWGTQKRLLELFGNRISSLSTREQVYTFRLRSPAELADFLCRSLGPVVGALALLDDDRRRNLRDDLVVLAARVHETARRGLAIPSPYLEAIARVR